MLQDELAELLYGLEPSLVFHGGTAIWRCYGGNRFSEDLDFYSPSVASIDSGLAEAAQAHGLEVTKYKKTDNLVFAKVSNAQTEVRLELNFSAKKDAAVMPYERTDGSSFDVLVLSPEQLILEKISAYSSRRFIRDLYDLYHLGGYVREEALVGGEAKAFLADVAPPVDEGNLKAILYTGVVPSFEQLVSSLRRRWA